MTIVQVLSLLAFVGLGSLGLAAMQDGFAAINEYLFGKKPHKHTAAARKSHRMSIVS